MLNISKKIYVGWDANTVYSDVPEAEIIPIGDSPGEKRKMAGMEIRHTALFEHDNRPLPGFTLIEVSKQRYSSPDSTWLIIDPRGFKVRISATNLFDILKVTGITEGLVQQKCVWAREDSRTSMTLIPVSADTFTEAVDNTDLIDSKVDIADVNIGDTVLLQNKKQGVYKGTLSLYCTTRRIPNSNVKVQSMLRKQIIEITPNNYFYSSDAKILKVISKASTPVTREESVAELNSKIAANLAYFTSYERMTGSYHGSDGRVRFVSTNAVAKVKIKLEEIDATAAKELMMSCVSLSDEGVLVLETVNGVKNIIDFPWYSRSSPPREDFDVDKVTAIEDDRLIIEEKHRSGYYGYNATTKASYTLDNFAKFYKIVKCVKSDTYI